MYCRKCGRKNRDNAKFCSGCGEPLVKVTKNPAKKSKIGPIIIVLVLIAVLVALTGVYFAINKGLIPAKKSSKESEVVITEETDTVINTDDTEVDSSENTTETFEETETERIETKKDAADESSLNENAVIFECEDKKAGINIRSLPQHESELVGTVHEEKMYYIGETDEGLGSDNKLHTWYHIKTENGYDGWVRSDLVIVNETSENKADNNNKADLPAMIKPVVVTSISQLADQSGKNYSPYNLIDDDLATAFVEGFDDEGIGEVITFEFDKEYSFSQIVWYPGYDASEELFRKNGYPVSLEFRFSNGESFISAIDGASYGDKVTIDLEKRISARWIEVTFRGAVAGSEWSDTCISEICFYGTRETKEL